MFTQLKKIQKGLSIIKRIDQPWNQRGISFVGKKIIIVSFLCQTNFSFSATPLLDTTLFLFLEDCSDSSINNCWYQRDDHHDFFWGFYEFDTSSNKILYKNGFYKIGSSSMVDYLNREELNLVSYQDNLNYIDFKEVDGIRNTDGLAIEMLGYSFFNELNSKYQTTNYSFSLKPKKISKGVMGKISNALRHNSKGIISGNNRGKLFLIKFKYIPSEKLTEREILFFNKRGKIKRPYTESIKINTNYIVKIEDVKYIPPTEVKSE